MPSEHYGTKINKYHMLLLNENLVSLKHKILFYIIWGVLE